MARLNRRQLHGRAASGALRTLVLRVEHCFAASVRRPELTIKPTGRLRLQGIRCNDADLDVIAFGAFEQPVFETKWTRCNALQHHPRLAVRTAKAFNRGHELCGRGHDTSLHLAGALAGLSVTENCQGRSVRPDLAPFAVHESGQYCSFTERFSTQDWVLRSGDNVECPYPGTFHVSATSSNRAIPSSIFRQRG
jgi:hypothetical protein